jgi:hypothetical protein
MLLPRFCSQVSRGLPFSHQARHAEVGTVLPASPPAECARVPSYTNAKCYGVVQICTDCCRLPNPRSPATYDEHCGGPYVCGVCLGLPF